jgi:sodium/bile acid cotransporter 7
MFVTPVLAGLTLNSHGGFSLNALQPVALQMLLPFLAGQLLQPWIGDGCNNAARSWAALIAGRCW